MSHFNVLVKISGNLAAAGATIENVVETMLAPYIEQYTEGSPYHVFSDETDALREEYETFEQKNKYPTFESFAEDYYGHDKRSDGRYGHMSNPNAKWDWWTIGGRWRGFFPVADTSLGKIGRPGVMDNEPEPDKVDIVAAKYVDRLAVRREMMEKATNFYNEYQKFLDGHKFSAFEGPRDWALSLGLIEVVKNNSPVIRDVPEGFVVSPWSQYRQPGDERYHWYDLCKKVTLPEILGEYLQMFNPILTFAYLDENGWMEKGRMGWFGMSDATPAARFEYQNKFAEKMAAVQPDDILVVVDCHI